MRRLKFRAGTLVIAVMLGAPALTPTTVAAQPIPGTTCSMFPADSVFNTDISSLPVDSHSNVWKNYMNQNSYIHPDLGTISEQYGQRRAPANEWPHTNVHL